MGILSRLGSRWRGPVAVSAAVAVAAALAGYAAAGAGHAAGGHAGDGVVTLGNDGQAWRLTASVVSVRSQGAWVPVSTPVRPAAGNSVAKRGSLVLVAGLSGTRLTLAASRDGGRSWATSGAALAVPADSAFISVAPDARHWLVGAPGAASAGSVRQFSQAFVGSPGGALTPLTVPGPVASLAWRGPDLVVPGGPADSRLYVSSDLGRSWTDASKAVLGFTPPAANVPPAEPAFGPVLGLGAAAVVPVERVTSSGLSVDLEAATGAASYKSVGRVFAPGSYGGGSLQVASSSYGAGAAALVLPGTTTLYVVSGSAGLTRIAMSGLPASPDSVSFQSAADGIAQVTVRACGGGKSNCTVTVSEYATSDGGRTWDPA
jgi:hypothetical protein